ncbi:hypothetical protein AgCh_015825 [Apium graveolens]
MDKAEKPGLQIDQYAFDLYHMTEIHKLAEDNRFLIDKVGKVEAIQNFNRTTKNNQEKTLVKFEISDGRNRIKVTLFDKLGELIDEQFRKLDEDNIFIIISCARAGKYDGAPNLTNYPATRVYINPDHYSVKKLKQQLEQIQTVPITMEEEEEEESNPRVFTVKEIRNLPADFKQCNNCPRIIPYPNKRFRLCTLCSDNTRTIAIIFPDSEVSRIADTTVMDIQSNSNYRKKMSSSKTYRKKFESLSELQPGKYDNKIKARVIRLWRGTTKTGEEFTSFNVLLLDEQASRVHALVPRIFAEELYCKITVGNVHTFKNFIVQLYKPTEIFRCVRNEYRLILTKDTKIEEIEETTSVIPEDVFDFYDHSELKSLLDQKLYLADVVGIIKKYDCFTNMNKQISKKKSNAKLVITDGRYQISTVAFDKTGATEVVLEDREVRTLIGKRARELSEERQQHSQEETEIMNTMVTESAMMMEFINTPDEQQGRGSRPGKSSNHPRERLSRGKNLMEDYFVDRPIFNEDDFRRRYRMRPHVFNHIMTALCTQDSYWHQKTDAIGLLGLLPQQKMTAALRMLAYGAAADQCAEICRMGESTTLECMKKFCQQVKGLFGQEYLRAPTPTDLRRLLTRGEQRGFPGMIGSIDCMHWEWKNCPSGWGGAYSGRKGRPTIILEAVASYDTWIWHAFFGVPGAQNDINVLGQSHVFDKVIAGNSPTVVFHVNGKRYNNAYYLADGIYPRYSTFVKTISNPATQSQKLFAKKQEAYRKDVERCFGILQSRWAILRHGARMHKRSTLRSIMMTCIILHNMIVEDEFVEEDFVEPVEEDLMNPLASQVYDGPVDSNGVRIPFAPVQRNGRNQQAFWDRIENLESAYIHTMLQNDLVEHNWAIEANQ